MQRDYGALCIDKLMPVLAELEEAIVALEDARRQSNEDARRQAEEQVNKAAERAINIEIQWAQKLTSAQEQGLSCQYGQSAHLGYIWIRLQKEDADKRARQASAKEQKGKDEKKARILQEAANALRAAWQNNWSAWESPEDFGFVPDDSCVTSLPLLSFMLRVPFTLRKPYLSRDDTDLYIFDNPVKKEWVFKKPCVAPSQWKGALRSAMMRQLAAELHAGGDEVAFTQKRLQLYRLFGNEKDGASEYLNRVLALKRLGPPPQEDGGKQQEEWRKRFAGELQKVHEEFDAILRRQGCRVGDIEGFQGRLRFFPTFFDKINLEVINPHDRESGAGSQPIYFECVPRATPGTFTLIYVPYGFTGQDEDPKQSEARKRDQVAADLEALAGGVISMLTVYGFGAKTSSGYGVAEDRLAGIGTLAIRAALPGLVEPVSPVPQQAPTSDLPRYLESPTRLHAEFRREDGSLKLEDEYRALLESRGQKYGKKEKQLYDKAFKWWEREGKGLLEEGAVQPEREPVLPEILPVVKRTFVALSALQAVAQEVAGALRKEGGV